MEELFGPHNVDLMSLDSNVMIGNDCRPLRHFTLFPSMGSAGVNVFAQDLSSEINSYAFPPLNLIFPLLKFFEGLRLPVVTMVVPEISPTPVWWPFFKSHVKNSRVLCQKGR